MNRFYLADGQLTAYALGCGYVQVANTSTYPLAGIKVKLWREHGCYHVSAYDMDNPGKLSRRISTGGLGNARRIWRDLAREHGAKMAI